MRKNKARIHIDGVSQLFDGLVIFAGHIEAPAQTEIRADGEGIQVVCAIHLRDTLAGAPHAHQVKRISLISGGVAGVQFHRTPESAGGGVPIPIIVEAHGGKRSVGFGKRVI